jgi:beta-glucosidase
MKPIQLKGFKRVELNAGEEKTVVFKVSPQQLAQYIGNEWIINPGKYEFKAATSCTDIRLKSTVEITGEKVTLQIGRTVFFSLNK